ncbi:hypothetical protein K435DRAFT_962213 [Dendrothele bispora CBS 962.96]|uniref:Uncharacterized protein n=1 Tax=Dendrothele bispora (strain CBS 962.96) TaxID=1314807 RepID=A0A4S8MNM4_DENBC|nr:hypothetical protein K435DRAFT_962213 [Dendrothele bispora CBS 962.96]
MNLTLCLAVLFVSVAQVVTSPTSLTRRDRHIAWRPRILTPVKDSIWYLDTMQNVTWDTSDIPEQKVHENGTLVLARPTENDEHLYLKYPLAEDFPLALGYVSFFLTDRPKGDGFAVCLMGDSGDLSELFTIA